MNLTVKYILFNSKTTHFTVKTTNFCNFTIKITGL